MQVKRQQLEPDMEQQIGSNLGQEYVKAVYCHPAYSTHMQSTLCEILGWMKHKLESRFPGRNINNLRYACRWHHPCGRKWRRPKKPLDESERGEWKCWLKAQHSKIEDHGIWSHHFMAIDGETVENSDRLFWGASKSLQMVVAAMKWKATYSLEGKLWPT